MTDLSTPPQILAQSRSPRRDVIGDAELWLGDNRDVLPCIAVADHVITDPPYSANTHAMAKTNKGKGRGAKLVNFAHMADEDFDGFLASVLSISRGWTVATCDYRHAARHIGSDFFVRLGAWVKPNPMPQISADRPGQGFETVLIMHSGRVPKRWNRGGGAGVWSYPVVSGAAVPTQKPIGLVKAFVGDFTNEGDIILDPFLGSGTTGVAALSLGRRFVGVEISSIHYDVARRRIEREASQGKLGL